jgi:hypothetical protein
MKKSIQCVISPKIQWEIFSRKFNPKKNIQARKRPQDLDGDSVLEEDWQRDHHEQ